MKAVTCTNTKLEVVDALGDPEAHAKILIDPKSDAAAP